MDFFTQRLNKGGFMEENKMGVMPIDKLIISMSLPIMISMLSTILSTVFLLP